jgi:D-beta-D-heptose 7-phosphate kinase/D-beta-D-heptose 1-phosphate adenosyltransferase
MIKTAINGTFDILHCGHLSLIDYARRNTDSLLVCIDSDDRVRDLKGNSRPINSQEERKTLLENIKGIDEVLIFDNEQELRNIYKNYQPDRLVIGVEYKGKRIIGAEHCRSIDYFERLEGYSTTQKIKNIISR